MRLTEFAAGGGCGCKLPPDLLRDLLKQAQVCGVGVPPQLLVGADSADDAAVWKVSDEVAVIATTDFFAPVVDDPEMFGAIAAANALSDVWAMGGTPLFALALLAMPRQVLSARTMGEVLAGGRRVCGEAGVVVAGGHSIDAKEPLFGLAVVGSAHPDAVLRNSGALVGDAIVLGKPLGVGVLSAALRRGRLGAEDLAVMAALMTQLNKAGAALPQVAGVRAMTDVTGFGLVGHLAEMCRAAGVGAVVRVADVPMLPAAVALAREGVATGASGRNWDSIGDVLGDVSQVPAWVRVMLSDPQTGGGLLVACAPAAVAEVAAVFARHGQEAVVVGEFVQGGRVEVVC